MYYSVKMREWDLNRPYFTTITILIFMWLFFTVYKPNTNGDIEIKLRTNSDFKIFHLTSRNFRNQTKNFRDPRYRICEPYTYGWQKLSVNLWDLYILYRFFLIICTCVKNVQNQVNTSPSSHISNMKNFDIPINFLLYISVKMWVILLKVKQRLW